MNNPENMKNERTPSETLHYYRHKMRGIFGKDYALIGIAFMVSSHFRHLYLDKIKFFPLMFCYGDEGSGKYAFGALIQNFCSQYQQPITLSSGTPASFFYRLEQEENVISFCEEYTDEIDEALFQGLKMSYEGVGREIGATSTDKRTVIQEVNTSLVISGQYLPNRDDLSLMKRSIVLGFPNHDKRYYGAYEHNWALKLQMQLNKDVEWDRLRTVLSDHLHSLNEEIKNDVALTFLEVTSELRIRLDDHKYQERTLMNYAVLLATMKLLRHNLDWEKHYEYLYDVCLKQIVNPSIQK